MNTTFTPETVGEPFFGLVPFKGKDFTFDEVIGMIAAAKKLTHEIRVERPNVTTMTLVLEDRVVGKFYEHGNDCWCLHVSPAFSLVVLQCMAGIKK